MNVLHINASLRQEGSTSREMSGLFINKLKTKQPINIETLDLAKEPIPHINQEYAKAMYLPFDQHTEKEKEILTLSNTLVDQLLRTDLVVLGTPMYNFGIPSVLKSYIDHISRSGRTFIVPETGFHGQLKHLTMVIINSRGGAYVTEATAAMDFVKPYLESICGFLGIESIHYVSIEPTTFYGPEAKEEAIVDAKNRIDEVIEQLAK